MAWNLAWDLVVEGILLSIFQLDSIQIELNYHGYNATPIAGNPQGLSVYVDGVRVNEPFSNSVMWDLIPSFSIDQMQMVGGSNPIFGLNTLGGALSIQTKSGQTFNKTAVDISTGSWGRKVSLIETGGVSKDKKFDYYLGYEHFSEDGWRDAGASRKGETSWKRKASDGGTGELEKRSGERECGDDCAARGRERRARESVHQRNASVTREQCEGVSGV